MHKIGLYTFFSGVNPGTFLQAYCTYEAIRKALPNARVELINQRGYKDKLISIGLYSFLKSPSDSIQRSIVLRRKYKHLRKESFCFSPGGHYGSSCERALKYIKKQNYDAIFVGSDTILRLNQPYSSTLKDLPPSYLEGVKDCHKILCSASSCVTQIDDFSSDLAERATKAISDFANIGVRDKNTERLLLDIKIASDRIALIPDPTYTMDIDTELAEKCLREKGFDFSKPSVFIHLSRHFVFFEDIIKYFRKKGWQILTLGYPIQDGYPLHITPWEWSGIFKFITLSLTESFHDSIFALRNGSSLFAIDCSAERIGSNGSSKTQALLEQVGLSNHHSSAQDINSFDGLCAKFDAALNADTTHIKSFCENSRKIYYDFIDQSVANFKH